MTITYPPEMLPKADGTADVLVQRADGGFVKLSPPGRIKTWGDYYSEARAAGMDDASACHAADTAVP